eukprot:CAMPEP_0119262518 /NCGR_PEP_ID=MMETSP1329-20130426/2208_1 /TAXON_ID=114041 /ORGANISM="Genus nov. species nov., Strain RCC1024" /LENGTH=49 /DNA_ID= /DNA_START= /DNA_END= /DNA_ORIENTATION=
MRTTSETTFDLPKGLSFWACFDRLAQNYPKGNTGVAVVARDVATYVQAA